MKTVFLIILLTTGLKAYSETIDVASYNLGLAHTFVPLAKERTPQLIEALKNEGPDVACLQEVWSKEDQAKMVRALKDTYPYAHVSPIEQVRSPKRGACKVRDLFGRGKFATCMQTKCKGKKGDDFTSCVIKDCRSALNNLKDNNPICAQALMAQVGKNPLVSLATVLNPFGRPGLYSYKGSIGTMILSKLPFDKKGTGFVSWSDSATMVNRGHLYATVKVNEKKAFVSCNHFTANSTKTAPYTGHFQSWEGENFAQAQRLLQETHKLASQLPQVVMGDFNCSFGSAHVQSSFEKACQLFPENQFEAPISRDLSSCSYCGFNNLVKNKEDNLLLDHIFVKNASKISQPAFIFHDLVTLKTKKGEVQSHLSDHFGVKLRIKL